MSYIEKVGYTIAQTRKGVDVYVKVFSTPMLEDYSN